MNDATPKLDCRGARGLAIDAQLGQLDAAGRAALDRHVAGCEACRHEVAALQQTVALLRKPALVAPSAGFAARVGLALDAVDAAGGRRFAQRERASVRLLDHARFRLLLLGHQLRHSRRWQLRVAAALLPLLVGIVLLLRVPVAPAGGEVASRPQSAAPSERAGDEMLPPSPDLAPWRPKFDDPVDVAPAEPPTPVEELAARDQQRVQDGIAHANELDEAALAALRAARRAPPLSVDAPSGEKPAPPEPAVVAARTPVERALDWLARNQRNDGSWTPGDGTPGLETSVTALALLALLSDGHLGAGGDAPLDVAATRAVAWLAAQQEPDGRYRGGGSDAAAQKVSHALATLALVERHVRLRALDPKSAAASAAHHDRLEQALSLVEIGLDQAFHDAAQRGSGAIAAWSSVALATARHGGLDFHLKASSEALAEKMTAQVRPDRADLLAAASHAVLAMADRAPSVRDPAWSRAVGDVVKGLGAAEPSLRFLVASALASGGATTRETWQQFERALEQQLLPQQAPTGYFESGASWDELDGGVACETALGALALQVERRQRDFAAARKALGGAAPRKRGG